MKDEKPQTPISIAPEASQRPETSEPPVAPDLLDFLKSLPKGSRIISMTLPPRQSPELRRASQQALQANLPKQ